VKGSLIVTTSTELAITVRGLSRKYGDFTAVDGVDLDVQRGEIFALLGPNGAGKTTTVEILEGYRHRDSGTVSVLGHDPAHPTRAWRSRLGIVLQGNGDLRQLTVEEVVRHFATFYPDPRDVDEVIAAVGLEEKRKTRTINLSGGQRRRVDVALGILGRPELVFMDEPTTGFDPEARRQFWDLIDGLRDEGTTVLLTTHYLEEAEHLADRVGVIAGGRILEIATPETLGGRAQASARVSWLEDGVAHTLDTDEPTRTVTELAARHVGEIDGLTVSRQSLEDTYLAMIRPFTEETS
jgi:ABC-2 type transport system ATP-binding protein